MKVTSKQVSWNKINEISPPTMSRTWAAATGRATPSNRRSAEGHYYDYICDLGNRLEVNLDSSNLATVNI